MLTPRQPLLARGHPPTLTSESRGARCSRGIAGRSPQSTAPRRLWLPGGSGLVRKKKSPLARVGPVSSPASRLGRTARPPGPGCTSSSGRGSTAAPWSRKACSSRSTSAVPAQRSQAPATGRRLRVTKAPRSRSLGSPGSSSPVSTREADSSKPGIALTAAASVSLATGDANFSRLCSPYIGYWTLAPPH